MMMIVLHILVRNQQRHQCGQKRILCENAVACW